MRTLTAVSIISLALLAILIFSLSACTNDELTEDFYLGVNPSSSSSDSSTSAPSDSDADGLSDDEEADIGTTSTTADTDRDGIGDGLEFVGTDGDPLNSGADPNPKNKDKTLDSDEIVSNDASDSDEDGLGDLFETANDLDKNNPDIDADGYADGLELVAGTDPFDADSKPTRSETFTNNSSAYADTTPTDTDKDGISNSIETNDLDTSTTARDSDSDGISDGLEYLMGSSEKDPASVPAFTIPERPESSSSTSSSSSSSSSSSKKSSSSSSSSEDTESETDDDEASLG